MAPLRYYRSTIAGISMTRLDRRWTVLLAVAVLAAAAPARPPRHTVAGHFNVPRASTPRLSGYAANVITNPRFESGNVDGGWHQCGDVRAYVTRDHPFSGSYDEYSGTANGQGEPTGNSGVCQQVTIRRRSYREALSTFQRSRHDVYISGGRSTRQPWERRRESLQIRQQQPIVG